MHHAHRSTPQGLGMTFPSPRPHQQEALDAATTAVAAGQRRISLQLAPGAGKTLLGCWLASALGSSITVVAAPSLALLAQTLEAWRSSGAPFDAQVVCSDPSTADGDAERGGDIDTRHWLRHRTTVTTSPSRIAHTIAHRTQHLVLFSTYHSLPAVAAALRTCNTRVDVLIADEAHHLAGRASPDFRMALDDAHIPVRTRVFLTATPVVAVGDDDAASMDDPELFGTIVYRLTFAEAISRNLLSDFRVLIYQTSGDASPDPVSALLRAADEGLSRVLTFHGRVAKARSFAAAVDGVTLSDGRRVRAYSLSANDPMSRRVSILDELTRADGDLVVVSSARCLAEGVNIPAVDGVLFADPKSSEVSAVQAVGRALRLHPGKSEGLVLLPVCVSDDFDVDTALSSTRYRQVWKMLRALRTLDTSIVSDLRAVARSGNGRSQPSSRITFDVPHAADLAAIAVRSVDFAFRDWDAFFGELVDHVNNTGVMPASTSRLGQWAQRQRIAYRAELLDGQKAARLEDVPGWAWDERKQLWVQQLHRVREVCADGINTHDEQTMNETITQRRGSDPAITVGYWLAQQRIAARNGALDDWRRQCLYATPGWSESEVADRDAQGIDLLAEYVAWKGHSNPPHDLVEDDFDLGVWVNALRRAKVAGTLPLPLLSELRVVTPSSGPAAFQWFSTNVRWMLSLEALYQFVGRENHCRPPEGHVESLPDIDIAVQAWVRVQRHTKRIGKLDERRIMMLERVPGWLWEIPAPDHVVADVGNRHGTRAGYAAGCKCEDCCAANLADHRRRERLAAAGIATTDLVDAGPARAHLRILAGRGAPLKGIARAVQLNPKTIAEIHSGERRRIHPHTATTVLAVTLETVHAHGQPGTRVDGTPTWKLLDSMIDRGWPRSWIARELGMKSGLQLQRGSLLADTAAKVAALDRRLGDRVAPPRRCRTAIPTLDEVIAAEQQAA